MGTYRIGHWTDSTRATLAHISEQNARGKHPRYADLASRTMQKWSSPLKAGGYLTGKDGGLLLSTKGIALLSDLQRGPSPQARAPSALVPTLKSVAVAMPLPAATSSRSPALDVPSGHYTVTIVGPAFTYSTGMAPAHAANLLDHLARAAAPRMASLSTHPQHARKRLKQARQRARPAPKRPRGTRAARRRPRKR